MKRITAILFISDLLLVTVLVMIFSMKLFMSGILVYILYLFLLTASSAVVIIERDSRKVIVPILAISLIFSGLNLFGPSKDNIIKEYSNGKYSCVLYELNVGAMGHTSYLKNTYYTVFDTKVLSVKWLTDSKRSKYDDFL